MGSIPGSGRFPGGGNGNPLQYSCLENPMNKRSLAGYSPWGLKESDMTERLSIHTHKGIVWYFTAHIEKQDTVMQNVSLQVYQGSRTRYTESHVIQNKVSLRGGILTKSDDKKSFKKKEVILELGLLEGWQNCHRWCVLQEERITKTKVFGKQRYMIPTVSIVCVRRRVGE